MDPFFLQQFLLGILFGTFAASISYRIGFLTRDGALATGVFGSILFGIGSWQWAIPMLAFFVPSSFLSQLSTKYRSAIISSFEKGRRRDARQVLANGGIGAALALLWFFMPQHNFYLPYLGAVSAAAADTWETELGILFLGKPSLITRFQSVERGTSGGISGPGILGGLAGAALIAATDWFWSKNNASPYFGIVILSGMVGSFVDSLLGATLQAQYRCTICKKVTERVNHCETEAKFVRGRRWMINDLVNFICSTAGACSAFVFAAFRAV